MILEKLGMVFIMLIIVAIIVGVICFITYIKALEDRVYSLERRNEREDDERFKKMIKKVEQEQDSQPKV